MSDKVKELIFKQKIAWEEKRIKKKLIDFENKIVQRSYFIDIEDLKSKKKLDIETEKNKYNYVLENGEIKTTFKNNN